MNQELELSSSQPAIERISKSWLSTKMRVQQWWRISRLSHYVLHLNLDGASDLTDFIIWRSSAGWLARDWLYLSHHVKEPLVPTVFCRSGAETEFKESVEMKQISQRQMLESYFQPLTPVCLTCEPYACEFKKINKSVTFGSRDFISKWLALQSRSHLTPITPEVLKFCGKT